MRRRILIPIDPEPEVIPEPVPSEPTALGILNWVSSNQIPSYGGGGIVIETRTPIKESGVPLSDSSKFGPWIPVPELRQYPSDTKSLRELCHYSWVVQFSRYSSPRIPRKPRFQRGLESL